MSASRTGRRTDSPTVDIRVAAPEAPDDPATLIGFGYNLQGPLDLNTSTTSRVVTADGNVQRSKPGHPSVVNTRTFTSRDEVMKHFAASASASYSGVAFSGEFSATYGSQSSTHSDVAYGVYDITVPVEILKLDQTGRPFQSESFKSDADVQNLPSTFSSDVQEQFFRVFRKFGTHFVSGIDLGGRLHAYTTAFLSSTMTKEQASANMSLEYKAVLVDAAGKAQTDWGTLGETWTDQRHSAVTALGGDPGDLAAFIPGYGDNKADEVQAWMRSVQSNPDIARFTLSRLSTLFDGERATAVDKGIDAYLGGVVRVKASGNVKASGTQPNTVALPHQPVIKCPEISNPRPSLSAPFFWFLLFDPDLPPALENTLLNKAYFAGTAEANDLIDADISKAMERTSDALVIITGVLLRQRAEQLPVPSQMTTLVSACGYDLNDLPYNVGDHGWTVLSIVGRANNVNPCAVNVGDPTHVPITSLVGLYTDPITIIDQSGGTVLSPVAAAAFAG